MQPATSHGGRPRQKILPGTLRRARQSQLPHFTSACLSEYNEVCRSIRDLAPSFRRNLATDDLFAKPIPDLVEDEIRKRLVDPDITDPMPKVDELEASRLPLRKRRQMIRWKAFVDPMLSRLRLKNWIGDRQIQLQIEARTATDRTEIEPGTDFIMTMVVFHHEQAALPVQELQLLGSNTLQEAAGALVCFLQLNAPALHDVLPSSYFLIEDQFYDDQLSVGAQPLSQPIIEWARQERRFSHKNLGPFRSGRPMHRTRLGDIRFRPGSIYHYVHLGACRHAIMFTEVAIISDQDVRKRAAYPLQTALIKEKRQHCGVCDTKTAAFVTYGDRLAPANPFFYCDHCYYAMHYSKDGNLLYNGYKVYPYICD